MDGPIAVTDVRGKRFRPVEFLSKREQSLENLPCEACHQTIAVGADCVIVRRSDDERVLAHERCVANIEDGVEVLTPSRLEFEAATAVFV